MDYERLPFLNDSLGMQQLMSPKARLLRSILKMALRPKNTILIALRWLQEKILSPKFMDRSWLAFI